MLNHIIEKAEAKFGSVCAALKTGELLGNREEFKLVIHRVATINEPPFADRPFMTIRGTGTVGKPESIEFYYGHYDLDAVKAYAEIIENLPVAAVNLKIKKSA